MNPALTAAGPFVTPENRNGHVDGRRTDVNYVKVNRSLKDHPRFKDGDWLKIWMFLLLSATHTGLRKLFSGQVIALAPGQLITSRPSIVEATGVERSKAERILKTMENEQQIEQRTSTTCRLITVLNWGRYQRGEQQNKPPPSSERAADELRVSTHKNGKNEENGKNSPKAPKGADGGGKAQDASEFQSANPAIALAEEIYALYPRKTASRATSLAAIRKALSQVDADTLRGAVARYAKVPDMHREKGRFIPSAAKWFGEECWRDYLPTPSAARAAVVVPSQAVYDLRTVIGRQRELTVIEVRLARAYISNLTPEDEAFLTETEKVRIKSMKSVGYQADRGSRKAA